MTTHQLNCSKQIRQTGVAEGISYIVLLFVAMPLKYLAGMPMAVKVTGWLHGILFMAFLWALWRGYRVLGWNTTRTSVAFLASLIPFGTFWLHSKMKTEEQ